MIDPIFRVGFPIQRRFLDINVLVGGVEVDVADGGGFACLAALDADRFEVGGRDEVDVLARVGEDAEHAEGDEAAHGACWGTG